jgi:hypothetical protein
MHTNEYFFISITFLQVETFKNLDFRSYSNIYCIVLSNFSLLNTLKYTLAPSSPKH